MVNNGLIVNIMTGVVGLKSLQANSGLNIEILNRQNGLNLVGTALKSLLANKKVLLAIFKSHNRWVWP